VYHFEINIFIVKNKNHFFYRKQYKITQFPQCDFYANLLKMQAKSRKMTSQNGNYIG